MLTWFLLPVQLVKNLERQGQGWSAELGSDDCGVGWLVGPCQL